MARNPTRIQTAVSSPYAQHRKCAVQVQSGERHVPAFYSPAAAGNICSASKGCRRRNARTAFRNCCRNCAAVVCAWGGCPTPSLIEAGALTEAAFAVIHLELPLWQIRRITYDEGEWYWAISRQRELPEWLDEAIETTHASLTLAIVSVYIETLRQIEASRELAGCRYRGHEMINSSWFAAITSPSSLRIPT